VLAIEELFKQRVTNVVFMGMGEPLLNIASVLAAHHVLNKVDFSLPFFLFGFYLEGQTQLTLFCSRTHVLALLFLFEDPVSVESSHSQLVSHKLSFNMSRKCS
jgi:hypothetical protein